MENNSSVLDSDIVKVDKYEPHKIANGKNEVTFFVASDDIDLADLQRYRIQAQTEYLIAINATNKDYDCLKLADNVILCSLNEVPLVMQAFQRLHSGSGIIGMSWDEVKWAISGNKNDDIEPVIIEDDIPMKTTNPTQRAGNSIKEYLRQQQQRNKSES